MTATTAVCPFCGLERRLRVRPGPWIFNRHPTITPGLRCPGSAALLPVPNVWTDAAQLHHLKETTPVEIFIVRRTRVAHLAPGDTIAHPETGEPFDLEKLEQLLHDRVNLFGRHPARPSRRHRVQVETSDEVLVLPTAQQAAAVWVAVAAAVELANSRHHGEPAPDTGSLADRMAPPWAVVPNGDYPALEVSAVGHQWHISIATPQPDEAHDEPAAAEG